MTQEKTVVTANSNLSSSRLDQFDGLRGLAIIIVVLSHCDILNQGGLANGIFFGLTGFFLINPFKDSYEQRFLSIWEILKFYKSRAVRILPSYYLILLFIYLQAGFRVIPKDIFLGLLCFSEIYEHLWFIYSYFWLMIIIPFVFMLILLLAKRINFLNNDMVCSVVFFVLAGISRLLFVFTDLFDIRFDQLLLGVCAGYLFRYFRKHGELFAKLTRKKLLGDSLIFFGLLFVVFSSSSFLGLLNPELQYFYIGWNYIFVVGVVMSFLVFLVGMYDLGLFGRFFSSKPMVFIGKLSLPIYLLNSFVIKQLNIQSKYFMFLCVFSISLLLAWVIDAAFSGIEGLFGKLISKNRMKEA